MNNLPRDKQIEIIAMLCEGVGQRAVAASLIPTARPSPDWRSPLAAAAAEMHDRMMVGLHVHRIECDELWAYVGHKRNPQKGPKRATVARNGRPIHLCRAGIVHAGDHRLSHWQAHDRNHGRFIQDLRQRVIGAPEISTDGLHFYKNAIRDAFGKNATHGVINKTYSVTHLNVTEASRRYSPGAGSSSRAGSRNGRAGTHFDKLRRTAKPHAAHGIKTVCSTQQRL